MGRQGNVGAKTSHRGFSRGFSLIELMVVIALISILMLLAVPSFTAFISNYRATGAANEILQSLTLARGEALKRGRRVTVSPNSADWRQGWNVYIDTGTTSPPVYGAPEILIFTHSALYPSITIAAAGGASSPFGGAGYVAFDGTGYPRTTTGGALTGGIVVTDSLGSVTNVRTLCLSNLGRPRIVTGVSACTSASGY